MGQIVGYWKDLSEAHKLVQSVLLAGVVEEIIEEGQLISKLPVFGISGKSIIYNREKTLPSASFYDINEPIPWSSSSEYADQVEVTLKIIIHQVMLDKFMRDTYKDPNDYESIVVSELRKGLMRTIEDKLIYGDSTVRPKEFDGLHRLVPTSMVIDGGEAAPSLTDLRKLIDMVRPKPDYIIMPFEIARRLDAVVQIGVSSGSTNATYPVGGVSWARDDFGKRVMYFDGIPIIRSDYMVAEQANTGAVATTRNERKKYSSGTKMYSIFACRFGQIMEGGLCLGMGGDGGGSPDDFFSLVRLDTLEQYNAAGLRMVNYSTTALGSTKALGAIMDITDADWTP